MSQPLTIEVIGTKGYRLGTLYYHWSGKTYGALFKAKKLVEHFTHFVGFNLPSYDERLRLIRYAEMYGGGVDLCDRNAVELLYPSKKFKRNVNRINGLVDITTPNCLDAINTSNYVVVVDFSTETYKDKTIGEYSTFEKLKEEYKENQDEELSSDVVVDIDIDLSDDIQFDDLYHACENRNIMYESFLRYKSEDTEKYFWATRM